MHFILCIRVTYDMVNRIYDDYIVWYLEFEDDNFENS